MISSEEHIHGFAKAVSRFTILLRIRSVFRFAIRALSLWWSQRCALHLIWSACVATLLSARDTHILVGGFELSHLEICVMGSRFRVGRSSCLVARHRCGNAVRVRIKERRHWPFHQRHLIKDISSRARVRGKGRLIVCVCVCWGAAEPDTLASERNRSAVIEPWRPPSGIGIRSVSHPRHFGRPTAWSLAGPAQQTVQHSPPELQPRAPSTLGNFG